MKVLSLGAGVQSTTLYLMATRGEFDLDCAIFADLGEEPAPVYRHLEWLQSLGGPTIHVLKVGPLGDHLMKGINSTGGRFASVPAFTAAREGEPLGKLRRQCTKEYKIVPIERFIRRNLFGLPPGGRMPAGQTVDQLFGISLDEAGRGWRIKANAPAWCVPRFPLIDRGMTRQDCVEWLTFEYGVPHPVPRSACVFCPYQNNRRWLWLRENDPEGFARAVEIDEAMRTPGVVINRNLNESLYLHQSCVPLRSAPLTDSERGQDSFAFECEGGCGL